MFENVGQRHEKKGRRGKMALDRDPPDWMLAQTSVRQASLTLASLTLASLGLQVELDELATNSQKSLCKQFSKKLIVTSCTVCVHKKVCVGVCKGL